MEPFMLLPAVVGAGFVSSLLVLAVLCLFRRNKTTANPENNPSSDFNDFEEGRNAFSLDDPYHSIDISYDVKTLSSADSGGDSAIEGSPNDSDQNIQANAETKEPAAVGNNFDSNGTAAEQPASEPPPTAEGGSDGSCQQAEFATEEPVYEMIAFRQNGEVNHNPSPAALEASLHRDASSNSLQTYEVVEGRGVSRPPQPPPPSAASRADSGNSRKSESSSGGNDDDVFADDDDGKKLDDDEDPMYSPVYDSTYVDCLSCSQNSKDSGVLLEMVPSPAPSSAATATPSPEAASPASLIRKRSAPSAEKSKAAKENRVTWRSNSTCGAASASGGDSGSWASIKARINQLKRLKMKSTSSTSPLDLAGDPSSPPPPPSGLPTSTASHDAKPPGRGGDGGGGGGSSQQHPAVSAQPVPSSGSPANNNATKLPECNPESGLQSPRLPEPRDKCTVQSPRLPEDIPAGVLTPRRSSGQSQDGSLGFSTPRSGSRPKPSVPPKPPRKLLKQ